MCQRLIKLKRTQRVIRTAFVIVSAAYGAGFAPLTLAGHPAPSENAIVPCALLEEFAGDVQIFNADRSGYLTVAKNASVPCGGWISVNDGWARVRHANGHQFQIGPASFVDFPAQSVQSFSSLTLYRGTVYSKVGEGASSLKVQTANSVVSARSGAFLVQYDANEDQTAVTSFSAATAFANRFIPESQIVLSRGETSQLNFHQGRTVPSSVKAASTASLRPIFTTLNISPDDASGAIKASSDRAERKLASVSKAPARVTSGSYERHTMSPIDDALLEKFKTQSAGGVAGGERLLTPVVSDSDRAARAPGSQARGKGRAGIEIQQGAKAPEGSKEDLEKRRLLEELSRLKTEF